MFFFFKQKTAYEIGTGDWSSDVCSSDLFLHLPAAFGILPLRPSSSAIRSRVRVRVRVRARARVSFLRLAKASKGRTLDRRNLSRRSQASKP